MPVPAPSGDNLLTQWLDEGLIHPPVAVGTLTFFPLTAPKANRLADAWTMPEALAAGMLVIEELDPPQVDRARFVNRSDRLVVCLAGQVIQGGRQNRTLARDALLGPDSRVTLELYCVQRGRWEGKASFGGSAGITPYAVRNSVASGSSQEEVWSEVAQANRQLKSAQPDEDLVAAMRAPDTRKNLAKYRAAIVEKLPDDCVGVVVARGGDIIGADLFNRATMFEAFRDDVLDSYLLDVPWDDLSSQPDSAARRPTQFDCRDYLGRCYQSRLVGREASGAGVGRLYDLSGPATGSVLGYEGKWMVHLHLALRVIALPVRPPPRPIPVPPPRPWPPGPMPRE